jgi:hypothetical protein
MTITIEVVGGEERVKISDSAGNEKSVNGFAMFGSNPDSGELYVFSWGFAHAAAHAVSEGLTAACNRGDEWYQSFYRCLLSHMVSKTGGTHPPGQTLDAEEVLRRWEKEDQAKADAEVKHKEPKDWN